MTELAVFLHIRDVVAHQLNDVHGFSVAVTSVTEQPVLTNDTVSLGPAEQSFLIELTDVRYVLQMSDVQLLLPFLLRL